MLPDEKIMCHYTGFNKSCFDMVTKCKCQKWSKLTGMDPQTGKMLDHFACADQHIITLLLSNNKLQLETGAAVESFRNEVVKRHDDIKNQVLIPDYGYTDNPIKLIKKG